MMTKFDAIKYINYLEKVVNYPILIKEFAATKLIERLTKKESEQFTKNYLFKSFIYLCYSIWQKEKNFINLDYEPEDSDEPISETIEDPKQTKMLRNIELSAKVDNIKNYLKQNSDKLNMTSEQIDEVFNIIQTEGVSKVNPNIIKKIRNFLNIKKPHKKRKIKKIKSAQHNYLTLSKDLNKFIKYKNHMINRIGFQIEPIKISKNLSNIKFRIVNYLLIGKKGDSNYGTFTLKISKEEFKKFIKENKINLSIEIK